MWEAVDPAVSGRAYCANPTPIGLYRTERDAARAYERAAVEVYGATYFGLRDFSGGSDPYSPQAD